MFVCWIALSQYLGYCANSSDCVTGVCGIYQTSCSNYKK